MIAGLAPSVLFIGALFVASSRAARAVRWAREDREAEAFITAIRETS